MSYLHTTRFARGKLPHWEVADCRYFVTVRLSDSLPRQVVERLRETHTALAAIQPNSVGFAALQRQYFLTMEKHLAAGVGTCLLSNPRYAESVVGELLGLAPLGLDVPHYSIMPNHWHALITPRSANAVSLGTAMKRVKGRTGRQIRAGVGGTGAIWQREWFDHWIRNEAEWEKTVAYIQNNPVKAGIVSHWRHHPWTK